MSHMGVNRQGRKNLFFNQSLTNAHPDWISLVWHASSNT